MAGGQAEVRSYTDIDLEAMQGGLDTCLIVLALNLAVLYGFVRLVIWLFGLIFGS